MKYQYRCTKCGKEASVTTRKAACECGGLWKLEYELPAFSLDGIDKTQWNLFRYRRLWQWMRTAGRTSPWERA